MLAYALPDLIKAARIAARKTGFPVEDFYAEALYIYVKCQRSNKTHRGLFARHLRYKLKRELLKAAETWRRQAHGLRRDKTTPVLVRTELTDVPISKRSLLGRFEPDTRHVVMLALHSRPELKPPEIRQSLERYLSAIGWSLGQIRNIFQEIKESL